MEEDEEIIMIWGQAQRLIWFWRSMEKRVLVFYLVSTIVLVALPMISANAEGF